MDTAAVTVLSPLSPEVIAELWHVPAGEVLIQTAGKVSVCDWTMDRSLGNEQGRLVSRRSKRMEAVHRVSLSKKLPFMYRLLHILDAVVFNSNGFLEAASLMSSIAIISNNFSLSFLFASSEGLLNYSVRTALAEILITDCR